MIERLESRIAPAALSATGKLLSYTDVDGDLVHVSFNTPMVPSDFTFTTGSVNGDTATPQGLSVVNLVGKPAGSGFKLTASIQNGLGDSHANIGLIDAGGFTNLGSISVDGDVHQIQAGGVKSFSALSMGTADSVVLVSYIHDVGSFSVKTDIGNSYISIAHDAGSINVGGSLLGTDQAQSGTIQTGNITGSVKIGGSVIAGSGEESGMLRMGPGGVQSLVIGGSVVGGTDSQPHTDSQISLPGNSGSILIKGDLIGRSASHGGAIYLGGDVKSVAIGGSVRAGSGASTGSIVDAYGSIGKISVGHDFVGADNSSASTLTGNGSIIVNGKIGALSIGGTFSAGARLSSGGFSTSGIISADTTLGSVKIGQIEGNSSHQILIEAAGNGLVGNANAIASVVIQGSSEQGTIVAGYEKDLTPGNFLSGIGSVQVGGNFIASRIVAATGDGGNGVIGDGNDVIENTTAKIGSVKIAGAFAGEPGSLEKFAIEAGVVAKLQVGQAVYTEAALSGFIAFGPTRTAYGYSFS